MAQSSKRILVINPNSTEAVTRGIDAAMEPLRMNGGPVIECVTLKDGPPGIESQAHVEQVVGPIGKMVTKRDNDCSSLPATPTPACMQRARSPASLCWASPSAAS